MPAPEQILEGLSRREEEEPAGAFFARVPWDAPAVDPEMPAGDFLDAVGSQEP